MWFEQLTGFEEESPENVREKLIVAGGAFGNKPYWILESLQKVIKKFKNIPLDVKMISYRAPNPMLKNFID